MHMAQNLKGTRSPGWEAQLLECRLIHQKVSGSIPCQDKYLGCGFDPQSGSIQVATDRCFCLTLLSLSLLSLPPSLFLPL